MDPLVEHLLEAPDTQLDASMKLLIKKWSEPVKAIEILEVLDNCIHGSLASGFMVKVFQVMYETACANENISHEEIVKLATWRDRV